MKRSLLATLLGRLVCPGLIQAPTPTFTGSLVEPAAITALVNNGASSAGNVNFSSSAAATLTLTALGEACQLLTNGGAVTVTLDSAYNIGQRLPQPLSVGQTFRFRIACNAVTAVATPTLSDTAVTLAGTTAVIANSVREYLGTVTQVSSAVQLVPTAGTTFTSIAQVGSTNNYTVTLGTNTVTPAVGTLVYLGVTTGTLPAGWYPINKVTSATSFVIAAPASGTAWTATAATVGTTATAPATYSPLITITGLFTITGTVTA